MVKTCRFLHWGQFGGDRPSAQRQAVPVPKPTFGPIIESATRAPLNPGGNGTFLGLVKRSGTKAPSSLTGDFFMQKTLVFGLARFAVFCLLDPALIPSFLYSGEYVAYYHECRPHQGLGNILLPLPRGKPNDDGDVVPLDPNKIKCEHRLGGILKHYYRDAA